MHRGRGFQQRGGVIGRVVRTVPLSLLRFVLLAVAAACGQAVLAGGKYDSVWGPMQYVIDVGSHHVMLNVCGTYRTQVLCKTGMARKSPREIPGAAIATRLRALPTALPVPHYRPGTRQQTDSAWK